MSKDMMRIWAVVQRDLLKFGRNPLIVVMSIFMPILYLVILGSSFQGKLVGLPMAVVNKDTGWYSRNIMNNLRAIAAGPKTFTISLLGSEQAALDGVKNGRYKAALIIPSDYSRSVATRANPEVGLFVDNTDMISSDTLTASVAGALRFAAVRYVPIRDVPGVIQLRESTLFRQVDYRQSLVPGVVIMAIFLGTLTTGAFNLVMDKFQGIEESYLLTPLTKMDIVAGLIISGLLVTTAIAVTILIISLLISGVPILEALAHLPGLLIIIVLTTLSLLSMMFVILGRFNHPRVVGILSGFMNVILFFPSGAIYPVESFPKWLKAFARVNPEAYAVSAFKAILFKGSSLLVIAPDVLFLLVFTAIMLVLAVMTFKRTL